MDLCDCSSEPLSVVGCLVTAWPMNKLRPATSLDVAKLAGVSKSAVSRAYNGGYVAPDARQKIMEAARRLRYRPNQAARSLSTNRSNLIGLAITALDNQFYPELVDELSDALALAGFRLVLFTTRGQADLEPLLDELLGFRLDGVILASTSFATRVATECADSGIPVIMLNNIDMGEEIAGVCTDNRAGAEAIAQHFIETGRRQMAVIHGFDESSASVERTRFFTEAIARAGLPYPLLANGQYTFAGTGEATRALIGGTPRPDAIFCVTDLMGIACIQAVRELGFKPGRDLAVAGFDNAQASAWPAIALTTYATPLKEVVDSCVSRLVAAIDGHPLLARTTRLAGHLVVRASSTPD